MAYVAVARPWCSPVAAISSGAFWLWPLVGACWAFMIWNWSRAAVHWAMWAAPFPCAVFAGVVLQAPGVAGWPGVAAWWPCRWLADALIA